jgi:hypothetical protein
VRCPAGGVTRLNLPLPERVLIILTARLRRRCRLIPGKRHGNLYTIPYQPLNIGKNLVNPRHNILLPLPRSIIFPLAFPEEKPNNEERAAQAQQQYAHAKGDYCTCCHAFSCLMNTTPPGFPETHKIL